MNINYLTILLEPLFSTWLEPIRKNMENAYFKFYREI